MCIKTYGNFLQKRIDLKTEDADRWQQSLQQQFIMVVAATRPEHPSFETATDTISDLLKVRQVPRKSWLAATSHRGSRGNIHPIILNVDWRGYREFFCLM